MLRVQIGSPSESKAIVIDAAKRLVYNQEIAEPLSVKHLDVHLQSSDDMLDLLDRRLSPWTAIMQRRLKLEGDVSVLSSIKWLWPDPSDEPEDAEVIGAAGKLRRRRRRRRLTWRRLKRGAILLGRAAIIVGGAVGLAAGHGALRILTGPVKFI